MGRKGKRRREAQRARRERVLERAEPGTLAAQRRPPAGEPARVATAAPAPTRKRPREGRKRRAGQRLHLSPWLLAVPVLAVVVGVVAVLVIGGASSGSSPGVNQTPDPRVAGKTPDNTINLNVDDVNFSLTKISGKAGQVIEFLVTNTGTQSHNMVVAGPDDVYDTADDFGPQPYAIKAGETGRVVVKIDDPGTYLFRCAFHPYIEFGTLVLQ